jgi:WD40 repeat protein
VARLNLQLGDDVVQPVWSPSGEAIAMELGQGRLSQRVVIWYFATDTRLELGEDVLPGHVSDDPTWSADSTRVAVARLMDLIILDEISGAEIHRATFGNAELGRGIANIAWSPDGASLLVEDQTGTISILDGQTYELVNSFLGRELYDSFIDIMWSHDSRHFAAVDTEDVRIHDSETGQVTRTLQSPPGILLNRS